MHLGLALTCCCQYIHTNGAAGEQMAGPYQGGACTAATHRAKLATVAPWAGYPTGVTLSRCRDIQHQDGVFINCSAHLGITLHTNQLLVRLSSTHPHTPCCYKYTKRSRSLSLTMTSKSTAGEMALHICTHTMA